MTSEILKRIAITSIFNPLKHGHVTRVSAWPFSSFKKFVQAGVYPLDWGGGAQEEDTDHGER